MMSTSMRGYRLKNTEAMMRTAVITISSVNQQRQQFFTHFRKFLNQVPAVAPVTHRRRKRLNRAWLPVACSLAVATDSGSLPLFSG
jgi:hypothetical protein